MRLTLLVACIASSIALAFQVRRVDIVLLNARVYTGAPSQPWVEALAIRDDRVVAIGTSAAIRSLAGAATRVIDAGGKLVIPGINDAHDHPGAMPPTTDLGGPPISEHDPTLPEMLERVKAAVAIAPSGNWITGTIGPTAVTDRAATRFALDVVAGNRLVMLTAMSGHGTLFSTAALRHLGVKDDEANPPGGFFERTPNSQTISGMAHEYAEYRLRRRISMEPDRNAQLKAFRDYAQRAAAFGITSVQGMMTSMPAVNAARLLATEDLPVRLRLVDMPMTDIAAWRTPASRAAPAPAARLVVSGTKWIMDGTPIERLMLLREPYTDAPDTRGALNFPAADLTTFLTRARGAAEQPLLHAGGDGSVTVVLDALEMSGGARWQRLRPRLEHGDMLDRAQFSRAKRLGVVVVQNPSHFMNRAVVEARLGAARLAKLDEVKSMVEAGIPLALGSDGLMNPFLNIMFATIDASNPREALTVEQALVAYTRGSAFAEFQEESKGSLLPGMLADLAVLSQDIFKVPAETLPRTVSVLTILGGRIVLER